MTETAQVHIGSAAADLPTPALVIDEAQLQQNIARMAEWAKAQGINLRPHAKTHKCPQIARRQLAAGAVGICCASVHEAEVMAAAGVHGLLLTSPAAPNKAGRIIALAAENEDFACTVDSAAQLHHLAAAADAEGVSLRIVLDLNVGTGRTGLNDAGTALSLAAAIADKENLRLMGVQAYMGHVQHIEAPEARRQAIEQGRQNLLACCTALSDAGHDLTMVTGGGTGSHRIDVINGDFNELQVGSYVFMDRDYLRIDLGGDNSPAYAPSLFVQSTVINDNHDGYGVTDAGLKSFATDGPLPQVFSPAGAGYDYGFMGDEHGRITWHEGAAALKYGDLVRCVVPHCDPTVNLHDVYYVVNDGIVSDIWPVAARGHGHARGIGAD